MRSNDAAIDDHLGTATATVLSVALLLDHLGLPEAARRVEAAVAFDLATRQSGSVAKTCQIGDRLAALGISYDDVVQVLEDEGVRKFDDSWNELIDSPNCLRSFV